MAASKKVIKRASLEIINASSKGRPGVIGKYLDIGEEASGGRYEIHEDALFFGIVECGLGILKSTNAEQELALSNIIDKKIGGEWSFFHIRDILIGSLSDKYIKSMDGIIMYLEEPLNQEERNLQKKQFLKSMEMFSA